MICVDCDRPIKGRFIVASHGVSMSGARSDAYAHPPGSPDCEPRNRERAAFRRAYDSPESHRGRRY